MERQPVESSNLASVGYDESQQLLEIEFGANATRARPGTSDISVYRYFSVPRSVYEGLLAADSKGKYLNLMVKGIYRYERIY